MTYKQYVVEAVGKIGKKMEIIDSALNNSILIEKRYLLEMDRDGAFAATISIVGEKGSYKETHKLIVFSQLSEESNEDIISRVSVEISKAIKQMECKE